MQKHIISVLLSFSGVIIILTIGTNVAYRTNVIPKMKQDFYEERQVSNQSKLAQIDTIAKLETEVEIARQKQKEAEEKLKEKLAEEDRLALERAQAKEQARINTLNAKMAAKTARITAKTKHKQVSKKSKAS